MLLIYFSVGETLLDFYCILSKILLKVLKNHYKHIRPIIDNNNNNKVIETLKYTHNTDIR